MGAFRELHVADAALQHAVKMVDVPQGAGVDDPAVLVVCDLKKSSSAGRLVEHLGVSANLALEPEESRGNHDDSSDGKGDCTGHHQRDKPSGATGENRPGHEEHEGGKDVAQRYDRLGLDVMRQYKYRRPQHQSQDFQVEELQPASLAVGNLWRPPDDKKNKHQKHHQNENRVVGLSSEVISDVVEKIGKYL